MQRLKQWGVPLLTGLVVLAAVVLPRQISALRDRGMLAAFHVEPLSEEDLTVPELSLPEKLELLWRAVQDPALEVFTSSQSLASPGDPASEQAADAFSRGMDCLLEWGMLPESVDRDSLEFQGGTRAVYVRSDGYQSVSMLYLHGTNAGRDSFWIVVDEETGLPVWIDCALRSAPAEDLPSEEELGRHFLDGLGLETQQRGPAMWEIGGAGGLVYSACVQSVYGRICVEPLGFADEIFGEDAAPSSGAPLAESW